jgi:hypothetical protein
MLRGFSIIRVVALAVATVLGFTIGAPSAMAVENGVSASGDPRIVSVYLGQNYGSFFSITHPMCSGYLISDRIVATAQHCTLDPRNDTPRPTSNLFVGLPGEKSNVNPGHHFAVAAVFRAEDYKKYDYRVDLSFKNDVAVLVLEKAMPKVTRAKLLNAQEFEEFAATDPEVWIGGYGLQNFRQRLISPNRRFVKPAKAPARFATPQELQAAVSFMKSKTRRPNYQATLVGLKMPASTGTICDGDSGSGFWSKSGSETIYLGVMNGPLGISNCEERFPDLSVSVNGVHPTYLYQSLFDSADKFVKDHPVKTTINCKNGKQTQKVTALKPKCPAGFKAK